VIVAVDTLFMLKQFRYTGTGVYLYNVLSQCLRIAGVATPKVEFHGFIPPNDNWAINGFVSPFLRVHRAPALARQRLWLLGGMAIHTARVRPDLVFLPTAHHSLPGRCAPVVTTILDAMPKRLPAGLVMHATRFHAMTWLNTKLASKIITISSWSKQDLVEIYGLDPEKIAVTYLGYDKRLYNQVIPDVEAGSAPLARFGIRRPFVLHHGMAELRKNVHRLIQAWDRVMEQNKSFDCQLVLAGPMGLGQEEIRKAREASPYRDQIIPTGALPGAELATLIKNATLCVIPSLYEGFCLPLVEAMACGVPTVASNSSCIPEVSGGILEYFDPLSVEEMAEVIRRALEDSELRDRLREKGLARAAQFSWERCAQETLRVLTETDMGHRPVTGQDSKAVLPPTLSTNSLAVSVAKSDELVR
jgi:glycosyltransferase involved in cell wall biosynthesis